MLRIKEEKNLSKADLKCIALEPLTVGGSLKEIINAESNEKVSTNSSVNSMISFENGLLFGLADGRLGYSSKATGEEYVSVHNANICTIDASNDVILTGSWDQSATILYQINKEYADLSLNQKYYKKAAFAHPAGVWAVKIVNKDTFLTGCADGIVRLFKNGKLFGEMAQHAYAVRSLNFYNEIVFSADNYGKMLKYDTSKGLKKSRNLDEMCFCMCSFNDLIIVGGENGYLFVINQDLEVLAKIKLPCTSCWSVKSDGSLIYVCGSNGTLYILERGESNLLQEDSKSVEKSNDVKFEEQAAKSKQKDGIFISEGVRFKIEKGKIYQEFENQWQVIGDVETTYDNQFTVELEGKNYTLSFNNDDNTHEIATKFLHDNKINEVHHQEIVNYIEKNFKKNTHFKRYETIDLAGISKFLGDSPIIKILEDIAKGANYSIIKSDPKNLYQIEELLNSIPLFIRLDICKYLVFKKIWIDLSFLFRAEITNKKEAKAFIFLMTNLVEDPPFSTAGLRLKIRSLRDFGLLTLDDVKWFESNCDIKSHK